MTVHAPRTLTEALAIRSARPHAVPVVGATTLMVEMSGGRSAPTELLSLRRVDELAGWGRDGGELVLGANLLLRDLAATTFPEVGLRTAAQVTGTPAVRNIATLGGNVCTASATSDVIVALTGLAASVVLASALGSRRVELADVLLRPGLVDRRADELLVSVRLPWPAGQHDFSRVGRGDGYPRTVAACSVVVDPCSRRREVCVLSDGIGLPVRCPEVERVLRHERWGPLGLDGTQAARDLVRSAIATLDVAGDDVAPAGYRRHALTTLLDRALTRALLTPGGGS